ncbi:hypothetical protein LIA77_01928 [Sarocladium implicatum]|nr:hypothetical protein LIA77_01928 [Sarocladium implicatum]
MITINLYTYYLLIHESSLVKTIRPLDFSLYSHAHLHHSAQFRNPGVSTTTAPSASASRHGTPRKASQLSEPWRCSNNFVPLLCDTNFPICYENVLLVHLLRNICIRLVPSCGGCLSGSLILAPRCVFYAYRYAQGGFHQTVEIAITSFNFGSSS